MGRVLHKQLVNGQSPANVPCLYGFIVLLFLTASYAQMETLLVKAGNGDQYEAEFKFLEVSYREDVDTGALPWHATEYFQGHPTRI